MDIYVVFYVQDRTNMYAMNYDIRRILAVIPCRFEDINSVCDKFRAEHQSLYTQANIPFPMFISRHIDTSFLQAEARTGGLAHA